MVLLPYGLELKISRKEPFRGDLLLAMAGLETFATTPENERPLVALGLVRKLLAEGGKYPRTLKDVKVAKYRLDEAAKAAVEAAAQACEPQGLHDASGARLGRKDDSVKKQESSYYEY